MPATRASTSSPKSAKKPARPRARKGNARRKLLDAARTVIRKKGYSATTVDELCAAAGVTKGAFFYHFASKEALGVAAAEDWSLATAAMFASAAYHDPVDPVDRVLAYIDFRTAMLKGAPEEFSCVAGTMLQEIYGSSAAIRAACDASISDHAATLEADLEAALLASGVSGVTAAGLALHTQAVLQGAFILAKGKGGPEVARESAMHLRRYFELLFRRESEN